MKLKTILATLLLCPLLYSNAFAEKIIVATSPWAPMTMVDLNKEIVGYDIDMSRAIAEELGMEVEFLNTSWDGIFATLVSKQADLIASSVTITDDRKKTYLFSDPYYKIGQAVIVPLDSNIKSFEDLKGKAVGIQIGTSAVYAIEKSGIDTNVKNYDDIALAFEDLKNGRIDAAMCDDIVGLFYANRKDGFQEIMDVAFLTDKDEELGFVFRKEDADLVEKVNVALKVLHENGTEAEINKKWFGE